MVPLADCDHVWFWLDDVFVKYKGEILLGTLVDGDNLEVRRSINTSMFAAWESVFGL